MLAIRQRLVVNAVKYRATIRYRFNPAICARMPSCPNDFNFITRSSFASRLLSSDNALFKSVGDLSDVRKEFLSHVLWK